MAENPATWGPLERAIHETLAAAGRQRAAGVIGLSTPRLIADRLRELGYIDEQVVGLAEALADIKEGGTHANAPTTGNADSRERSHLS